MNNIINGKEISEIHLMPYSHHDYSWTNSRQWHIWRYIQSFKEVLEVMRENSKLTWIIDNVVHSLILFEKYCPELLDEFKERVREGRIYIANGGMSLARPTYVGEETFIRNMVDGRKYFQKLFGVENFDFYYNADTAGGHSQLPQILRLGGHKLYRFQRPEEALDRKRVPRLFKWKGLDGSEIIVSRGGYGGFLNGRYANKDFDKQWDEIKKEFIDEELNDKVDRLLDTDIVWMNYGCDDFRPLRNLYDEPIRIMEFVDEWNKREDVKIIFSNPSDYLKKFENKKLPIYEGILDPCELSYNAPLRGSSSMWRIRGELDRLIVKTECIATFASLTGSVYPHEEINYLWNSLFEITGHAIEWAHKDDFDSLYTIATAAKAKASLLIKDLCDEITGKLEIEDGEQYVLYNILPWTRREPVKLHVTSPFGVRGFDLLDNSGRKVDYQIVDVYGGDKRYAGYEFNAVDIVADVEIPSMGYMTVKALKNGGSVLDKANSEFIDYMEKVPVSKDRITVSNGCLDITFSKGNISVIRDTLAGKVIHDGDKGNLFNGLRFAQTEKSAAWTSSWKNINEVTDDAVKWNLVENGPVRWVYRVAGKIGDDNYKIDFTVNRGERAIGFDLEIDSKGDEGYYAADFSCDRGTKIFADIPFGVEERKLAEETYDSSPESKKNYNDAERGWTGQYYARNWTGFNLNGMPVSIVSKNCSIYYRYDSQRDVVSLLLNRNIPLKDKEERWLIHTHPSIEGHGKHNYEYYIYFPEQEEGFAEIERFEKEKAQEIEVAPKFNFYSDRKLECSKSFIAIDSSNVATTAFYMDEGGYILRLYEVCGKSAFMTINTAFIFKQAEIVDFTGKKQENACFYVDGKTGTIKTDINPWQIISVKFVL